MTCSPKLAVTPGLEVATLAGGCFWGMEHMFKKYFTKETGLIDCIVGYCNGNSSSKPTYRQVCAGNTAHAEAIQVLYDPKVLPYSRIVEFFLRIHDPTQLGHQGPDFGNQYRSGIYTHSPSQEKEAHKVVEKCQCLFQSPIVTEIKALSDWWDAEDYHQHYLAENPNGYACPTHFLRGRFGEWIADP